MVLDKEDHYIETFIGSTYKIGRPTTVGQLRSVLEEIVADLPSDETLEIAEVTLDSDTLDYTLTRGIVQ